MTEQPQMTRVPRGLSLGHRGEIEFVQADAVLAIHPEGHAIFHCMAGDWQDTDEAQAIALDDEIAQAESRLRELQRQRLTLSPIGALPAPARQQAAAELAAPARKNKRYYCLGCGEIIGNLGTHARHKHPGVALEELRGELVTVQVHASPTAASVPTEGPGSHAGASQGPGASNDTAPSGEKQKGAYPK